MGITKIYYDFVFVVLVYKNVQDLKDFFANFKVKKSRVIVVNSFYDKASETEFSNIAELNNADFITIPNRGYGFGNNRGCEYALRNYQFQFLVISNADVIIEKINADLLNNYRNAIIAPNIYDKKGKKQNPANPYMSPIWYSYLMYVVFQKGWRRALLFCSIYSRIAKISFFLLHKFFDKRRIFAAHGAFLIIPKKVLKTLYPIYDERMFLFCEEPHLGMLARKNNINTYYVPEIIIHHKEDGSMSVANIDIFEKTKESYKIYYNNWIVKNDL